MKKGGGEGKKKDTTAGGSSSSRDEAVSYVARRDKRENGGCMDAVFSIPRKQHAVDKICIIPLAPYQLTGYAEKLPRRPARFVM